MGELEWKVAKLTNDIALIRINDSKTKFFEALWEIPEGISYNSYIVFTEEGGILFDTGPKGYDAFIEALSSIASPKDLKALVVNHMEPDHSGAIKEVLEKNPDIIVVSHPISFKLMKSFYGLEPSSRLEVGDGAEFQVGGHKIKFIHVPWLHWPETIVSYSERNRALFTGDVFGAYSIPSEPIIRGSGLEDQSYLYSMKKYFVNVIGAYRQNVINAVVKLRGLNLDPALVLPAHGAGFSGKNVLERLLSLYESWAACSEEREATVVFISMYGFSEEAAEEVTRALKDLGVEYKAYGFTSKERDDFSDAVASMQDSSLIVLVFSTYENSPHPLASHLVYLMEKKLCRGKKIALIGTYGWGGGVALSSIEERLRKAGFTVEPPIAVKSLLSEEDKVKIRAVLKKAFGED